MIPVLYPPNATDFSTFGLGVLTDTISCEVTEERNGVFECLLKYPVSGQHYGLITKECIVKAKPNDTAADQAFRIYRITKPLNGIVTIYGQHISYDLANVPVLPFSTDSRSPQLILSQLLSGDTRFTGWTDYSDAKAFSVTQPKSVRACLGGTEGSMLSKWYGEFEWDNFTVKFHSHRGQKTGVVIEYGKNLTALEQDEDNSGVYTALLPYAVYTPKGADEPERKKAISHSVAFTGTPGISGYGHTGRYKQPAPAFSGLDEYSSAPAHWSRFSENTGCLSARRNRRKGNHRYCRPDAHSVGTVSLAG